MKKLFVFLITTFVLGICVPPAAASENEIVVITEVSHRNFNISTNSCTYRATWETNLRTHKDESHLVD
jgi:hypothetical protein